MEMKDSARGSRDISAVTELNIEGIGARMDKMGCQKEYNMAAVVSIFT